MKKILGLDIGPTSIGWAIVEATEEKNTNGTLGKETETDINNNRVGIYKDAVGVRIIAQDTERFDRGLTLNDPKGSTLTPTANRRVKRGIRRMKSRYKLRRDKLGRILDFIGMKPDKAYYTNEKGKRGENNDIGKAIYQLRDRAIREKISLNELGRILSHLNQWRGYSSERFAKEEKPKFDYHVVEVIQVDDSNKVAFTDEINKGEIKYYKVSIKIRFDEPYNLGDEENKKIVTELDGILFKKEIDFKKGDFVTVKKPEFKQDKKGKTVLAEYYKITFTEPDPTDWNYKYQTLQKTLTQWCESGKTVGSYFYRNFYETQTIPRIRNQVVNRNWYEDEFEKILEAQYLHHQEFFEQLNIEEITKVAFKDNQAILTDVLKKDGIKEQVKCLIKEKIIFFQRPWQQAKNKGQCPFEKIKVKKERTIKGMGKKEIVEEYVGRTVIPRSHPLFQEFKVWQQINNVRVYQKIEDDKIDLFANEKEFERVIGKKISEVKHLLFNALQKNKTLSWKSFAENELGLRKKEIIDSETGEVVKCHFEYNFRKLKRDKVTWEDIKLKGNSTKGSLQNILVNKDDKWFSEHQRGTNKKREEKLQDPKKKNSCREPITNLQLLWEIIYDITNSDAKQVAEIIEKHFAFDKDICLQLANLKFDDNGMGNLSAKAIRQILPLMSDGKNITDKTTKKVNSLLKLNNDTEEKAKEKVDKLVSLKNIIPDKNARLRLSKLNTIKDFTFLNYWEATAVMYGSHSTKQRAAIGTMKPVERHSMNNPIVEKIVNETISIVNDIQQRYGFDEVRIELSRELKASMEERQQMWEGMNNNAAKNEWAKQMLRELKAEFAELDTDPANKSNIDKIKIIEDVVKFKHAEEYKAKSKEYKLTEPSKAEVKKYLMWLEQNFKCPYTDQPIPFTDVFARGKVVEIEHIIPRERYYLNSYVNKVITWKEVNQAKAKNGNRTAYEFIVSKRVEETVKVGNNDLPLIQKEKWESHVKAMFPRGGKQMNLLRKEIPEDPINRTLNETQYINKKLKEKLGELVGNQKVWVTSGAVTDILRERWHLNDIMKELMRNRFENFEIPTGKKSFKLKTLAEQQTMLDNIQIELENPVGFKLYKIPVGKKFIEINDIDEVKIIQDDLVNLVKENFTMLNKKVKPYEYSTTAEAFEIKNLTHFTKQFNNKTGDYEDREIFEGYSKRLDHRHHAMDAIIIACTKQNHIQYINTLNAITSTDQESDESKKLKYSSLKADVCIGNSSKKFKTPWHEDKFIPAVRKALSEVVISHKNTRLLISPSKHSVSKDIKPNKIASIRGELHKETNYAKKNYFEDGKIYVNKLIPQIFKVKKENQNQSIVFPKTFEEIIKQTVLKEKYQDILIALFGEYEERILDDLKCKEYSKAVLQKIEDDKLLVNSQNKNPLQWLSTYSVKDKSARPLGHSMDFNKVDIINKIADPRIKRLALHRLRFVNEQKVKIDNLNIEKKEKDKLKRDIEILPLYSNAIYEVRVKLEDYEEKILANEKPYKWVELRDFSWSDYNKIWYAKAKTTKLVMDKLKNLDFGTIKQTYFTSPIFLSEKPIEIKKTSQLFAFELHEITKGRYVYASDVFMTYFFIDDKEKVKDAKRNIEFLKLLDAARIVSFEKPDKIDYSKFILKPGYELIFTLAKNDLVYLPLTKLTHNQTEEIDWSDKQSIVPYLYIVKDMNPSRNEIVFQQFHKADSIKITEADSKSLFSNPELKEQIEKIKYGTVPMLQCCIKVFTDKLGKKVVPYWEFPNGCWERERAKVLGLI
jgi:CRISPR-associated endonuclease Csn1